MKAENWVKLKRTIEELKAASVYKRNAGIRHEVRELERLLDSESDDDEKPAVDDD